MSAARRRSAAWPPIRLCPSPRFEVFFALFHATGGMARSGVDRAALPRGRLPGRLDVLFDQLGRWPLSWIVLADVAGVRPPQEPFSETLQMMRSLPADRFARAFLYGQLHDKAAVEALLREPERMERAVALIPAAKRDWLQHLGLYPFDRSSAGIIAMEKLASAPARFQMTALDAIGLFWEKRFQSTWQHRLPRIRRIAAHAQSALQAAGFEGFARTHKLNIEFDSRRQALAALRGGYVIRLRDVREIRLYPSCFDTAGFWTVLDDKSGRAIVNIPFTMTATASQDRAATPTLADPALVLRALGDATRFAMATLLARGPKTSTDLAHALAISKPTVTHHVHLLRESGLLHERVDGKAVWLTLRRSTVAQLSRQTLRALYGADI